MSEYGRPIYSSEPVFPDEVLVPRDYVDAAMNNEPVSGSGVVPASRQYQIPQPLNYEGVTVSVDEVPFQVVPGASPISGQVGIDLHTGLVTFPAEVDVATPFAWAVSNPWRTVLLGNHLKRFEQEIAATQGTVSGHTTDIAARVVGPASATGNSIAAFDGTTGKLIRGSSITLGGSGGDLTNVSIPQGGSISSTQYLFPGGSGTSGPGSIRVGDTGHQYIVMYDGQDKFAWDFGEDGHGATTLIPLIGLNLDLGYPAARIDAIHTNLLTVWEEGPHVNRIGGNLGGSSFDILAFGGDGSGSGETYGGIAWSHTLSAVTFRNNSGGKLAISANVDAADLTGTVAEARLPVPVSCSIENSAAQSIPTASATLLTFNTDVLDASNMHSTSSNTERITVPETGWYSCSYGVVFAGNATGRRYVQWYRQDGTTITYQSLPPAGANLTGFAASFLVYLTAGTYIYARVYQDSGGALDVGGAGESIRSKFQLVKVPGTA